MRKCILLVLVLILLTGCTNGRDLDKGSLSSQDIDIIVVQAKQAEVRDIVRFIYKSPTVDEFDAFIKDYRISVELLEELREVFKQIDIYSRVMGDVSIIDEGYYFDNSEGTMQFHFNIVLSDSQGSTRILVFTTVKDNILTSIRGYLVQ